MSRRAPQPRLTCLPLPLVGTRRAGPTDAPEEMDAMVRKKMEGDENQRRQAAREARKQGQQPSELD